MEKLTIELETLTPMYMGDALMYPEIRSPSIKGLLRFWYRALDPEYKKYESICFGDAGDKGASPFTLRVKDTPFKTCYILEPPKSKKKLKQCASAKRGSGLSYLGYPFGLRGGERLAISPGQKFIVEMLANENIQLPDSKKSLSHVLASSWWGLTMLGGMGSRSRRCFGSVRVVSVKSTWKEMVLLKGLTKPNTSEEWWKVFCGTIGFVNNWFKGERRKDHLALSKGTKFALIGYDEEKKEGFRSWKEAMDDFGSWMQCYRSGDGSKEKKLTPEQRAAFGLPLQGYDINKHRTVLSIEGTKHQRGASPLLGNVVKIGNEYFLLLVMTDNPVIAPGEKIRIEEDGKSPREAEIDYSKLKEFYDEIMNETEWSATL